MNDPSRVFVTGPFAPFAEGFLHSLLELGYTPISAASQLQLMAHLSRWFSGEGLDARVFSQNDLERFLNVRRGAGYTHWLSLKGLLPMLTYLRTQGISPAASTVVNREPVDVVIDRYRHYLVHERGLGQLTVRQYSKVVRPFLRSQLSSDGTRINWESLDASRVTAFVVAHTPNQSRSVARATVTGLRSLLRYLFASGLIKQQLTMAVPAVAGWRLAAVPKALQPNEIRALLAVCDRAPEKDFAISPS